ncbi:MAG: hypothetical protein JW754_04125 [Candidatus Aenigmarchaeota archaeon]|nr:hypothetical protein [Candidatus Aenigmarchaeota archaeon]
MVNKELFDYIKSQVESGQDARKVRDILIQAGWLGSEIDSAMRAVEEILSNQKELKNRRIQEQQMMQQEHLQTQKVRNVSGNNYTYGLLLSMIGGVLILINGLYTLIFREITMDLFSQLGMAFYLFSNQGLGNMIFGGIGMVFGIAIIAVNFHKMKPHSGDNQGIHRKVIGKAEHVVEKKTGIKGLLTIMLSVIGFFFGGMFIGPVIGVIGGILDYLDK